MFRITCKELENGAHPVGQCRAEYVSCWEGAKSESRCPGNFIFNPHNGQCDYEQNVPECLNRGRAVQQPLDRVKAVEPPRRITTADPFCIGRTDGYYSDRCSSEYNACIAGKFYKLKCPGTLKFSQSLQRCEPDNEVEECTNPCITRGDGIHQLGCQNKYLVCFSGNARWFSCPAGLIYNRATASCEDSARVPECRLY
ncbi:chitin binding Peritrophin-A domain protein [Teladorsagia circumcincta]|uniref:Chitin binding Peritrophin-A domain protein n=1 Tax=Teladorsagia circumcincta TaxID=45464 RepID=A0A2G9T3P2_TELCI|nr:chitin binding Peritrophin-A domain protein [Teladorsagia circumcincta]